MSATAYLFCKSRGLGSAQLKLIKEVIYEIFRLAEREAR